MKRSIWRNSSLKKRHVVRACIAGVLLSAAYLLIFLAGNDQSDESKTAAETAKSAAESSQLSEQSTVCEIPESILGKTVPMTDEEKSRMKADMLTVGDLCCAHYLEAGKITKEYYEQGVLGQDDLDAMEETLYSAGYCVVNSDTVYPDYLENGEMLDRLWENAIQNRDAEAAVWSISSSGSVNCRLFQSIKGKGYCIYASGDWDDADKLRLTYLDKKEILYWDMTASGFLYQDVYPDRHWGAANLLRLQPVDHYLYDMTEKYIDSIGYHNVNLFLLDWDSSDFGNVCFNDLLFGMYRMQYGDCISARDFPYADKPFSHSVIPADLFESVIFEHFNITMEEFRTRALYDAQNDAYPWQDLSCGNILYYPDLIPEVTEVTDNDDGTVTLLVNVICPDKHTDHLFEHEITLKIDPDGAFRYLSNRIVYRSGEELPSPQARIDAQQFDSGHSDANT